MRDEATRASVLLLLSSFLIFTFLYLVFELLIGIYRGESDYSSIMYKRYQKIIFGIDRCIIEANKAKDPLQAKLVVLKKPAATKKSMDQLPPFSDYMLTNIDNVWDFSVNNTAKAINFGWRPVKRTTIKVSDTAIKLLPTRFQKMLS